MKSRMPIVIAIILGVVAVVAIKRYIDQIKANANAQLVGRKVVGARVDIQKGKELTEEMVRWITIPERFITAQHIQGDMNLRLIIGRKLEYPVQAGIPILWSQFESEHHGGLSSLIPEDKVAFTLETSSGIKTGLIQPNDKVDLILSLSLPKPPDPLNPTPVETYEREMVNFVLLQNVTVLAVGEVFGPGQTGEQDAAITLALTLQESQLVMFSSQNGEIGIVLRREGESTIVPHKDLPRITFDNVEDLVGMIGRRDPTL